MRTAQLRGVGIAIVISMTLVFMGCGGGSSTTPMQNPDLCSGAAGSPPEFLYATAKNQILGFTVNQASGALCSPTVTPGPISTVYPSVGIVSISTGFVYVSDAEHNQVYGFSVNKNTGTLTPIASSPFALPVTGVVGYPGSMATDPHGKFLYISNYGAIDGFAIDSATGGLTPLAGSPFPGYYGSITVSPNGSFLYASHSGGIFAYAINSSSGTLTPVAGSPFVFPFFGDALPNATSLAVDPSNSFVYAAVSWQQSGAPAYYISFVGGFSIDAATGSLTSILNPPFVQDFQGVNNLSPYAIAISGSFLYVSNTQGLIAFSLAPGTGLLTPLSRSPFPPGTASGGVAITPDGKFLYQAVNTYGMLDNANMIDFFSLDPSSGVATSIGSVTTPTGPLILDIASK